MSEGTPRPPLPAEPLECRQHAEAALGEWAVRADAEPDRGPLHAIAWALLAIAGELATIRRATRPPTRRG